MADLLATPADLASALQRDVDTASATLALEVCTALVQTAAGGQRIILSTSTDEVVYGGCGHLLRLPQQPVVSVASVSYGGSLLTQGTASGTWRLAKYGIWRDLGWTPYDWDGPSPVSVTYTHGHAPGTQELQLGRGFTLSLARGLFTNPDGTIREQIDDYSVAYAEASAALDASPSMQALLRKQYGPKARMVSVF